MKCEWLIVGLGNPGWKYKENRHNIGWLVLDRFAEKHKQEFLDNPGVCMFANFKLRGKQIAIAKPTTYMNDSGRAVMWLSKKYEVSPEKIIVVVDEYNFPVCKVHLKSGGSDGGHNGLYSIAEKLGSAGFFRLRCGIGNDFASGEMADYVLSNFPDEQKEDLELMLKKAVDSLEAAMEMGTARAMSLINSERLWRPLPQKPRPEVEMRSELRANC